MKESTSICSPVKSLECSKSCNILTEFQVDNYRFLVVSLNTGLEDNWFSSLPVEQPGLCTVVQQFEVQGQKCVVVKTDQIKVEQKSCSSGIDLTTLLTDRELQIATLVALGRSNKQVAKLLQISEWTVSTHLRRIFIKLDVDSRAAMVFCCASLIQKLQAQTRIP